MEKAGLGFVREHEHTIFYEGIDVGTRRADFIIGNDVVVEIKAVINLEDVHLAQAKNYVEAYNKPIGLLINFGAKSLQYKKIFNKSYNPAIPIEKKSCESSNPVNPDPTSQSPAPQQLQIFYPPA